MPGDNNDPKGIFVKKGVVYPSLSEYKSNGPLPDGADIIMLTEKGIYYFYL
jgi:hypothetical protein